MALVSSDYRGPLIVVAVGAGFLLVGAVPVAVTFSTGVRTSAKIIGVGFVGFGLLLMLPGLGWCVWVRVHAFRKRHRRSTMSKEAAAAAAAVVDDDAAGGLADATASNDEKYNQDATTGQHAGGGRRSARTRSWPSNYMDPPSLIVSDNEVCRAAVVTVTATAATSPLSNGGIVDTVVAVDVVARDDDDRGGTDDEMQPAPPVPLPTQRSDPGPAGRSSDGSSCIERPATPTARSRALEQNDDDAPP